MDATHERSSGRFRLGWIAVAVLVVTVIAGCSDGAAEELQLSPELCDDPDNMETLLDLPEADALFTYE
jgi:hypothetical protein